MLRVAFFVWSAVLGKILTIDNLWKRHVIVVEKNGEIRGPSSPSSSLFLFFIYFFPNNPAKCCCVEDDAFVPFVVSMKGKEQ